MKIRKLFIGAFLLTFIIGLISIFLLKNKFIESRSESLTTETISPILAKSTNEVPREAEKSDAIFYETAKNYAGAALLDEDYWEKDKKYKFEMLRTGEFHGDEVDAKTGESWLGFFEENGKYILRSEKITVRRVPDFVYQEKTGKSVSVKGKTKPLFLLKNAGKFGEGEIETIFKGATFDELDNTDEPITEMKNNFVRHYQIGGRNYTLRVEKIFNKKLNILFALVLEFEQTKQILHISSEDYLGTLFWVGDLDRDGKPDFFLAPWIKENITETSLLLSSEAEKNHLVKKVAVMLTVGC